ncbi:hypothetical protein NDU88_003399 [Pleurodeles waltl]|uniref:Uncharacterized protein n=1 Tax=Pleurodeles waltl TaxID=8319 RepID=A0AAV7WSY9_PLEWA|nr:hypothetical protein NDU88_003399 [Pleurodeles waltl]
MGGRRSRVDVDRVEERCAREEEDVVELDYEDDSDDWEEGELQEEEVSLAKGKQKGSKCSTTLSSFDVLLEAKTMASARICTRKNSSDKKPIREEDLQEQGLTDKGEWWSVWNNTQNSSNTPHYKSVGEGSIHESGAGPTIAAGKN